MKPYIRALIQINVKLLTNAFSSRKSTPGYNTSKFTKKFDIFQVTCNVKNFHNAIKLKKS